MVLMKRKQDGLASGTSKKPRIITDFFCLAQNEQEAQSQATAVLANSAKAEFHNGTGSSTGLLKETVLDRTAKTGHDGSKTNATSSNGRNAMIEAESNNNETIKERKATVLSGREYVHTELFPEEDSKYTAFCARHGFDKDQWIDGLTAEQRRLLSLEIEHLHVTWLAFLHTELTKPYFIGLKLFLLRQAGTTVFPAPRDIYSWSHYTPLPEVKCLVLGQDPYHNFNQAHGLAFLVLEPTRPPPSLLNIYKALKIDFPDFVAPDYKQLLKEGRPGGGNLTKWARRGVLMLNTCLTVEAHKANSHAGKGWEQFTERVVETAISYARDYNKQGFVIMAWGAPAQKRIAKFSSQLKKKEVPFLVLETAHPSPLSARRGFFDLHVFEKCNAWLKEHGKEAINWGLIDGNNVC